MVTEEAVESSWREIGALSADRARKYMLELGRRQRELLAFVTTMTKDLSVEAQETTIYAFVVVCRMFEKSGRKPLPKAKRSHIIATYERISDQFGRLVAADELFLQPHAAVSTGNEPWVMRYVAEVLLEPEDPETRLPDEELGEVFMCLQTVVDVLHDVSTSG